MVPFVGFLACLWPLWSLRLFCVAWCLSRLSGLALAALVAAAVSHGRHGAWCLSRLSALALAALVGAAVSCGRRELCCTTAMLADFMDYVVAADDEI
eukprot:s108_g43.t1